MKPWVEDKLGLNLDSETLQCTSLTFWGDLSSHQYRFYGVVSSTISVELGGVAVEFKQIGLGLSIGQTISVNIEADFQFGNSSFTGSFISQGGDYNVYARWVAPTGSDSGIPIDQFVEGLASDLGIAKDIPSSLSTLELTYIVFSYNSSSKNFSFSCTTTLKIDSSELDLQLALNLTDNQGQYEKSFSGVLTVAGQQFDVVFDKTNASSLLIANYHNKDGASINLQSLAAEVSTELGSIVPEGMTITLNDALIARLSDASTTASTLLGANLGAGLDLTNLPLVGKYFPNNQKVQCNIQPLFATAAFT